MSQYAHDGLALWYGTSDAPAPSGTVEPRQGVSVTVGVRPANPSNTVSVRYRVDGRSTETFSAPLVANDFRERTQYFRAAFPTFWSGETVEYLPVVTCEGRRAPDPATASTFPSAFRLSAASPVAPQGRSATSRPASPAAYAARLEHLVHVRVPLAREPEVIGETPVGFLINWPPESGTLDGPAFRATVVVGGEHQTIVRSDGIGLLSVSVTVKTHDGALIALDYSGTVDYGEGWATRLTSSRWPAVLPVRSHIRLLTSHPQYRWLNRLDCLGVGEVRPAERLYSYDMYAVR
ncbi:DUF3237 domain-containing protein [Geodermatophilus sp. URMC 63]